jgi:transcriptional regulator with XRE-family HTH domain
MKRRFFDMSEMELMEIFGNNLESLLDEKGMSQNQLAMKIGVDRATVSRYINKQRMPTIKKFINICVALGCDPYDLLPFYEFIE